MPICFCISQHLFKLLTHMWNFFLLHYIRSLLSSLTVSSHLCQPFTSLTVRLENMYEPQHWQLSFHAVCCESAQIQMLCFHSQSFKKGILSQSAAGWQG